MFFDVFDHRTKRRFAGHDLGPAQPTDRQRHRVFGGEPAHGARQVNVAGQVVVAAMALDVDADRRTAVSAQVFGPGQPECDQQDVVNPGVKRRGYLTEQQAGRLNIQ